MSQEEILKNIKSYALNSGFPFENDVHSIIRDLTHSGQREVVRPESFEATNEEGKTVIRSVDYRVTIKTKMRTIPHRNLPAGPNEGTLITFLIDAKYTTSDAWWFIPEVPRPPGFQALRFPHLLPIYHEDSRFTASWASKILPAFEISADWPRTISGKKVALTKKNNEQQNDRDSITSYQIQMNQAVLHRLKGQNKKLGKQYSETDSTYFHDIELVIPIIVTNAPLFLMNPDINTSIVNQAKEPAQLAKQTDVILINQPPIAYIQQELLETENHIKNFKVGQFSWKECPLVDSPTFMVNIGSLRSLMLRLIERFENTIPKESR